MDLGLKGKRAAVMGASSGIGRAIAETLMAEGASVAICARNEAKLKDAAKEMGAAFALPCDLSIAGQARQFVEKAAAKIGGIDILICNTGGPPAGKFTDITEEQWHAGFMGLWMSTVESIQAALPGMKDRKWGRILLITSIAAKEPLPGLTVSNGLRAGLLGLTKSLSHEVAGDGVTINALLPGYTRTERLSELGIAEEKMTAQIPAHRLGDPRELAALTVFLASTHAGYVTGQAISCDGGYMRGL